MFLENLPAAREQQRYQCWKGQRSEQFLRQFPHRVLRQRPIDHFIVDFYCAALRLVIEVDGATHGDAEEVERDEKRTVYLHSKRLLVHRIGNLDIYENMIGVCEGILLVMAERGGRDLIRRFAPPSPEEKGEVLQRT